MGYDLFNDIDPVLQDYRLEMTQLPRTGDSCRHLIIAQHKLHEERVIHETIEHTGTQRVTCNQTLERGIDNVRKTIYAKYETNDRIMGLACLLEGLL